MPAPIDNLMTLKGTKIGAGTAAIQDYLTTGGQNLNPAQKAWCAAAVNASLNKSGMQGTGSNMAKSFLNWGQPTDKPNRGDIAVFSRGDPKGPYGHVGFFDSLDANGNPVIAGGNQGHGVSLSTFPADRLLGYRRVMPDAAGGMVAPEAGAAGMARPGMALNAPPPAPSISSDNTGMGAQPTPTAPDVDPSKMKYDLSTGKGWAGLAGDSKFTSGLGAISKALGGGSSGGGSSGNSLNTIDPINSGIDNQLAAIRSAAGPLLMQTLNARAARGGQPRIPGMSLGMGV